MTIEVVDSNSTGCSGLTIFCDGEMHVSLDWIACHHTLDYDNPDDIEYIVICEPCDLSKHHDEKTCYYCSKENHDEFFDDLCNMKRKNKGMWKNTWGPYHEDLIARVKETGKPVKEEIPWATTKAIQPHCERL